eukprot:g2725.t1
MPELMTYMTGLIGSTFSFLMGVLFGLIISCLLLVFGFFLLTKKITDMDQQQQQPVQESGTFIEDKAETRTPPKHRYEPGVMIGGVFSAPVWIVASSKWDITKPLRKFPPADIGVGYEKGLMKYHASIKKGILTFSLLDITNRWRDIFKVELEGCQYRLVDECLKVQNILWKKAPIKISHPNRALYQGESSFLMFCAHGADKEQWMITLHSYMHHNNNNNIRALQNTYKKFSKRYKNTTTFLGNNNQQSMKTPFKANDDKNHGAAKRGIWPTNWRRGGVTRLPPQSTEPCLHAMDIAVALDQRWKGERRADSVSKDELHHHHHHHRHHRKHRNRKTNHEARMGGWETKNESSTFIEESSHGNLSRSSGVSTHDDSIPTEDGVFGLNLFLARWSFDAMRNPDFKKKFHELILKKLGALRRPDFITELNVSGLELGSNFPEIKSVRSAPFGTDLILPQLLLDVSYSGGLEFKVEATVDLREGVAWDTIDRALSAWQGFSTSKTNDPTIHTELPEDVFDSSEDANETMSGASSNIDQRHHHHEVDRGTTTGVHTKMKLTTRGAKLATRMVESIPKIQLGLSVKIVSLEGTMSVWVSPPPACRLWVSFIGSPKLELEANPIFGSRIMKYSAYLGRVSSWLQGKIKNSFLHNLVFPMCADLRFPGLLGLNDVHGLHQPGGPIMRDLNLYTDTDSGHSEGEEAEDSAKTNATPDQLQFKDVSSDDPLEGLGKIDHSTCRELNEHELFMEHQGDAKLEDFKPLYQSLSDGSDDDEITEDGTVEDESDKTGLEPNLVLSDCAEFFDAQTSTPSRAVHENFPPSTTIEWPDQLPSSKSIALKQKNTSRAQMDGDESPAASNGGKSTTPTRGGLGGWFSEIVKTVQTSVEEGELATRRQRAVTRGNQFVKTARQKAGEQGTKLREAIRNRTAPLRGNVLLNRGSTTTTTPSRRFSFMD